MKKNYTPFANKLVQQSRAVVLRTLLCLAVISGASSCSTANRDIPVQNFEEKILENWQATGDLENKSCTLSSSVGKVTGFKGQGYYDTGHNEVTKVGCISSPEFTIEGRYINFLITGNATYNSEDCCVRVLVDGKPVAFAPATRYPLVEWGGMDLKEYIGKRATLEIYDNNKEYFLMIDEIYQSNTLPGGFNKLLVMNVNRKYLILPVKRNGVQYRMRLKKGKEVTEQFIIEMGEGKPDYWVYKDVSQYKNQRIELTTHCPVNIPYFNKIGLSDTIPGEHEFYKEKERPLYHFTARTGWINDPNGMIYNEGKWHLMFQHNPYGIIGSGLKHWGYAVSTDLVHWKEGPSAIVPDDLGGNHSGGTVLDFNNSAKLQKGDHKTLVAFWTAAGHCSTPSRRFSQCISYSTDNGKTWQKYKGNPVLGYIGGRNRDPSVIWHEPSKKWVMALYIDKRNYAFFNSDNLIDWKLTSKLEMPNAECPDLFQLPLDGDPSNKKWIFWGANGTYLIGDFDGEKFKMEGEPDKTNYGHTYAARVFQNGPEGRIVQTAWLREWPYPHTNFCMQMSLFTDLSLQTGPDGVPHIYVTPVPEMETLRKDPIEVKDLLLSEKENSLPLQEETVEINVMADVKKGASLKMNIRGYEIIYDRNENAITCIEHGKSLTGRESMWFLHRNEKITLLSDTDIQRFRIFVDHGSIEVFCNEGEKVLSSSIPFDPANRTYSFSAPEGQVKIKELKAYTMGSIW